jgi:tight adherence protein B
MNWCVLEGIKLTGIVAVTAYCFYDSLWGVLAGLPFAMYLLRMDYVKFCHRCRKQFMDEFRDIMQLIDSSINAGYSLENAFLEAGRECKRRGVMTARSVRRSMTSDMQCEFAYIENGLGCNRMLEQLLSEVGQRRQAAEITELAGLMSIAKQHGGDISGLIRQFNQNISRRRMLEQELDTMMSAKRFEGMIMVLMPYLIILYMKMTTPGYMTPLYETLIGRITMTGALAVTVGALVLMNKIVGENMKEKI